MRWNSRCIRLNMKKIFLLTIVLAASFTLSGQSKRDVPFKFGLITAEIAESVSYLSYHGFIDPVDDWYDMDDVGDIFFIDEDSLYLMDGNDDGKISQYMGPPEGEEGTYTLSHRMPDFWRYKTTEPGDGKRGSFGFMPVGTRYQYFIEVCPYDMELIPEGYEPQPGYTLGTTTITVIDRRDCEQVWVFYCRNVIL